MLTRFEPHQHQYQYQNQDQEEKKDNNIMLLENYVIKKIQQPKELVLHAHAFRNDFYWGGLRIVPLLGIITNHCINFSLSDEISLVMPRYRITLEDDIERRRCQKNATIFRNYCNQRWTEGDKILQWLHEVCGLIHGDVHLGNWFVTDIDHTLLLGDFGESKFCSIFSSPSEYLWYAGHERLEFHFNIEPEQKERKRLGYMLHEMEKRCAASLCGNTMCITTA